MGLFELMKTSILMHLMLFYVFLVTGLVVNTLQLFTLVIWPFNKQLYRTINIYLAYSLWSYMTFLGQYWSGSDVELYVSDEDLRQITKEHTICVMNHKYDVDWLMGWIVCQRVGILGKTLFGLKGSKILGKSSLRLVPVIGWCWIFTESIFIRRNWEVDSKTLVKDFDAVIDDYPKDHFFNILMFCEGTRFTEKKHAQAVEYAMAKGLPVLKHHLLPRTKGFCLLLKGAAGRIGSVYDLNVGIEQTDTVKACLNTIRNGKPLKSKILCRRIPIDKIPYDDEEKCSQFIHNLYKEKDEIFDGFARTGDFDYEKYGVKKQKMEKNHYDLMSTVCWLVLVVTPSLYYIALLFWNSELLTKGIILLIGFLGTFGIEAIVRVTQTEHGSKYGLSEKSKAK